MILMLIPVVWGLFESSNYNWKWDLDPSCDMSHLESTMVNATTINPT